MRLWSIHPKYLDAKGLVALWREALLAQKVLSAKTKGYKNHPQLHRFKLHAHPLEAIGWYLYHIHREGKKRGYSFNKEKILIIKETSLIKIPLKEILSEYNHLKKKLKKRDPKIHNLLLNLNKISLHPSFKKTRETS